MQDRFAGKRVDMRMVIRSSDGSKHSDAIPGWFFPQEEREEWGETVTDAFDAIVLAATMEMPLPFDGIYDITITERP